MKKLLGLFLICITTESFAEIFYDTTTQELNFKNAYILNDETRTLYNGTLGLNSQGSFDLTDIRSQTQNTNLSGCSISDGFVLHGSVISEFNIFGDNTDYKIVSEITNVNCSRDKLSFKIHPSFYTQVTFNTYDSYTCEMSLNVGENSGTLDCRSPGGNGFIPTVKYRNRKNLVLNTIKIFEFSISDVVGHDEFTKSHNMILFGKVTFVIIEK